MIVEAGFSLLATSLSSNAGQLLFSSMFLPRMLAGGLWALSLSVLRKDAPSTSFEDIQGIARKMPFASAGLVISSLTFAGMPLLSMFPIRLVLLGEVAQVSLMNSLLALAGMIGLLFSAFRVLAVLTSGWTHQQTRSETRLQITLIVGGILALLIVGFFPKVFYPLMFGISGVSAALP